MNGMKQFKQLRNNVPSDETTTTETKDVPKEADVYNVYTLLQAPDFGK